MYHKTVPKFSVSALDIIGMVFAPLGLLFVILGFGLWKNTNDLFFLLIFGGIGSVFLLLGVLFLLFTACKRRAIRKIVADGHYVMATVTSVQPNYSITVNGTNPFIAECSYTDPMTGTIHLFRSRNIYFDPTSILMDAQVPVYCQEGQYRLYYVDVDHLLPEVQRH